ncbi:MAG: hypothetical protein KDK38_05485 [Leptospiraceae bacterium]|nr:hypothetical protein [Leptospiraceae bacterium]
MSFSYSPWTLLAVSFVPVLLTAGLGYLFITQFKSDKLLYYAGYGFALYTLVTLVIPWMTYHAENLEQIKIDEQNRVLKIENFKTNESISLPMRDFQSYSVSALTLEETEQNQKITERNKERHRVDLHHAAGFSVSLRGKQKAEDVTLLKTLLNVQKLPVHLSGDIYLTGFWKNWQPTAENISCTGLSKVMQIRRDVNSRCNVEYIQKTSRVMINALIIVLPIFAFLILLAVRNFSNSFGSIVLGISILLPGFILYTLTANILNDRGNKVSIVLDNNGIEWKVESHNQLKSETTLLWRDIHGVYENLSESTEGILLIETKPPNEPTLKPGNSSYQDLQNFSDMIRFLIETRKDLKYKVLPNRSLGMLDRAKLMFLISQYAARSNNNGNAP